MINTPYIEILSSNTSYLHSEDKASITAHHDELMIISSSEEAARKIDSNLANGYGSGEASLALLEMVAVQQKAIVQAMFGINSNPEKAIAQALYGSIDIYAQKLSAIEGWTNGGVEMFRSSLMLMFEMIVAEQSNPDRYYGKYHEDLFHLALLEIMCNGSEYGLDGWYQQNAEDISHILESTGSGSHSLHEEDYNTSKKLEAVAVKLYEGILENGNIPPESFLGQILEECDINGLKKMHMNWGAIGGFWVCPSSPNNAGGFGRYSISPMLRLFLLSSLMESDPDMTKESVEIILTGTLQEIDDLIVSDFGIIAEDLPHYTLSPKYHGYTPSLYWLTTNTNWQIVENPHKANGSQRSHQLDWRGNGIGLRDLDNLYTTFPGRGLTQEEIEEINRIGDQVKMIQEALKYWIGLVRDEQLAIVRNIS